MIENLIGLPVLASEQGHEVDRILIYLHWLMGALFVGWLAYFIYALVRFRESRAPKADYAGAKTHASSYLEILVAAIEGVILLGFAIPYWAKAVDKFPALAESTVVRVTAEQFAWNSRYAGPDGVLGRQAIGLVSTNNPWGLDPEDPHGLDDILPPANEMVVPVDKPVVAYMTSKDVVHSFKVSPLRITQDAIPGMQIPIHFKPTRIGKYQIQCSQLCGNAHYAMRGWFSVVSPADYESWFSKQQKALAQPPTTSTTTAQLN